MSITVEEIMERKPFKRKSYIAMLLGFHHCYYTSNSEENEIIYGEKLKNLKISLAYLQCIRILRTMGVKDFTALNQYYKEKDWKKVSEEINKHNFNWKRIKAGLWQYFRSYELEENYPSFHSNEVKHRLYVNVEVTKRADFVEKFIEQCISEQIPYYFKVFAHKGQTDTVVIYVDTEENLSATIDAINRVLVKNPEITSGVQKTAPHLYKATDLIGYGFEPPMIDDKEYSFTQLLQYCDTPLSGKRNNLRQRIINDFNKGIILNQNANVKKPTIKELQSFSKLSRREQGDFFVKYFYFILACYGTEIEELASEIEENMNQILSMSQGKKL